MIIQSLLDNDLYKFSMSYAYMKLYPEAEGTFEFFDRGKTEYTQEFLNELKSEIQELSKLRLTWEEFIWCLGNRIGQYIPQCFWEWYRGFYFNPDLIKIELDKENHLHIIVTDKLYRVTFWEVPILAIVAQLRGKMLGYKADLEYMMKNLEEKVHIAIENDLKFSEFGTRRRFSFEVQDQVVNYLSRNSQGTCVGTSNVYLAKRYGLPATGTQAHEWFMFHSAIYGYRQANYMSLEDWVTTYDGDLGIALTDTFGSGVFFDNFSRKHAKLFDGVRHDSGDPIWYTDLVINRYKKFGIDPMTKTIIFSNALDFPGYAKLAEYCKGKIKCAAGIGTNLTNDVGSKPANIVMKLTQARINKNKPWVDCVKISDDLGKHMGNSKELQLAADTLGFEL